MDTLLELEDLIVSRGRRFSLDPLTIVSIGQILWAFLATTELEKQHC